jgi:hypothetical protein
LSPFAGIHARQHVLHQTSGPRQRQRDVAWYP